MKRISLLFIIFLSWHFSPAQNLATIGNEKPVTISGNLALQYTFYSSTGAEYLEPGSWTISGSPTLTLYGVTLPFSFIISEKERSFRQPFNQFGLSPQYKWVKLHLGYRNLNFSEYSLAGHQILGAGAEINHPKKINFGVMYGRLLRAVKPQDPEQLHTVQSPAFARNGLALKAGYGDEKNKVDLFFLTASDVQSSLGTIPDSLLLKPSDNKVMGIKTYQSFLKHFMFDAEFASSKTETGYDNDLEKISEKGTVLDAKAGFKGNNSRLLVKYLRIEPGFESFGKYFFQRDVRNITIDPGADFFNKKISLDLSLGFQRDHLDNNKAYKTERNILSGKMTARPWKFYTLNVTIGNYSIEQSKGLYEPEPALRVSQATFNATVMQQVTLTKGMTAHNFNLTYSGQKLSDDNVDTKEFSEFNMTAVTGMYGIGLMKVKLQATASYMFTSYDQNKIETKVTGPILSVSKSIRNNFTTGISYGNRVTRRDNDKTNKTVTITFSADYRFLKRHKVGFRYTYNDQKSYVDNIKSYNDKRGDISYAFNF